MGVPRRCIPLSPMSKAQCNAMGSKRKRSSHDLVNAFVSRVGQDKNLLNLQDLGEDGNAILMAAHLQMLHNFMDFCSEKKVKYAQKHADTTNPKLKDNTKHVESNSFKDRVLYYFGEHLPSSVVDELCQLVDENSYGKCHYCTLPAESLVLSVLHILLDASNNNGSKNHSSQGVSENRINVTQNVNPGTNVASPANNHLKENSINRNIAPSRDIVDLESPRTNMLGGKHSADKQKESRHENPLPALDTPGFLFGNELKFQQAPSMPVISKRQHNPFTATLQKSVGSASKAVSPDVYVTHETKSTDVCPNLGKLAEQIYNQKNVNTLAKRNTIRSVICGLAHSEFRGIEGVQLFKTNVTFSSLGESVEPDGHVENFFISGYCRKLFDDNHPRVSRKHFFYPRIGCCLIAYKSVYEVNTVKNSFLGANSALKLHLADMLCFPIHDSKHWFVFIVDLKSKAFVFLDSLYDENDRFQVQAREKIIPAFKECWYEHAEFKINLEDFQVLYPPVPKQNNVNDCGIFAVKFMELWDINVDLRQVFGQSDIANIRVRLANEIFFSKKNAADKSIVQSFFFESGFDPRFCN